MASNDEIRDFAKTLDVPDELPRDGTYQVMAARPMHQSEAVTDFIDGLYHAIYVMDQIEAEKGYAGVSFHLTEVEMDE